MSKRILIIGAILLSAWTGLNAQAQVSATLDQTKLLIGDQTYLRVTVKLNDPSDSVQDISFSAIDTVSGVEILKTTDLMLVNKETALWEKDATITSFEEGHYVLPSAKITITENGQEKRLQSHSLGFEVKTPDTKTTELQPIKGIEKEPINLLDTLPYILGLIVLLGIILGIRRLRNKTSDEAEIQAPEIAIPPHEIALTKLAQLDKKQLWQQGDIKAFQSELTFILRAYLEGRYKVAALESTTYEIIRDLKKTDITTEQTNELKRILETADLVKFAKSEPPIAINQQAFDAIRAFVLDTKEELQIETGDEAENND